MLTHIHPSRIWFTCRTRPILMATVLPAQSPGLAKARQVPRVPLPTKGVTSRGVMSCTPSSLVRLIIQCQSKLCTEVFDAHSISVCISPISLSARASSARRPGLCITSEGIVLTAFFSESIAETHKIGLVYLIQYGCRCLLDYLILQSRNPQWPFSAVSLVDILWDSCRIKLTN